MGERKERAGVYGGRGEGRGGEGREKGEGRMVVLGVEMVVERVLVLLVLVVNVVLIAVLLVIGILAVMVLGILRVMVLWVLLLLWRL